MLKTDKEIKEEVLKKMVDKNIGVSKKTKIIIKSCNKYTLSNRNTEVNNKLF